MAPTRPYVCACCERGFTSQRALTVHENGCRVIAERDRARFVPQRRRIHARGARQTITEPRESVPLDQSRDHSRVEDNFNLPVSTDGVHDTYNAGPSSTHSGASPTSVAPQPAHPVTRSHARRILENYRDTFDALPEAPPPLPEPPALTIPHPTPSARTRTRLVPFETPVDSFGRFRIYTSKPHTVPDGCAMLEDYTDNNTPLDTPSKSPPCTSINDAISPCPNLSTFYLLRWFWKQNSNSIASREDLIRNVLLRPGFNPADLAGVNLKDIDKKLSNAPTLPPPDSNEPFTAGKGWTERSVPIQVPMPRGAGARTSGAATARAGHRIQVPGLHSRTILQGIRKGFSQSDRKYFHHEPYHSMWIPPGAPRSKAQTLMDKIYTSPVMIEAHKEIQQLKISNEKCTLPRVCAAVMFGSDAAQLGPFSTKKAWMLYMWLGNFSKYKRCKPNSGACFDLAHIPSLPDSVKDKITKLNGRPPSATLLTHLRRELMHSVMQELLDAKFLQAWQHGIVIKCADGITRRVFPRIFTYSADYPERMFVVDLLHEIELGVWKSLLTHLIRIIHGCGSSTVAEFNRRFRKVPTFCNSTIRKFSEDVASLKRLAARDLEDILQCCMPVFKGLLPDSIDSQVQHLLFTLAYWHGLAKLRQHTSTTLKVLSRVTAQLGDELRTFQDATKDMEVYETAQEYNARQRRSAKAAQHQQTTTKNTARKLCTLNLNTPKFHTVGHYVATELQHRKIKAQWFRTNMHNAITQMTQIGDRGDALDLIQARLNELSKRGSGAKVQPNERLGAFNSDQPDFIGQSDRAEDAISIHLWLQENSQEQSVKHFMRSLKQHLLARITGDAEFSELGKLSFLNDRMYVHATLQINYTSYDVRRQHDVINSRTSSRYVLLPNDTTNNPSAHPFLYARVLGIYHARVKFCNRPPKRMDFLWVRWLDYDDSAPGGWEISRSDRVHYGQCRNDAELIDAFGFVDPRDVIRACHLIPDFNSGRVEDSISIVCDDEEGDWKYHSVNRFVDRDMLMRYLGGGVGHLTQSTQTTYTMEAMEEDTDAGEIEHGSIDGEDDILEDRDEEEVEDDVEEGFDNDDEVEGGSDGEGTTDDEDFDEGLYEL
ncbi:hypothetical protein FRC07_001653 [Ceratobasidium sp. 392]|nr:hypothetical protein FRC07_001653 [Ceratobasidium sp. 392]